jgi:hypothetical protein
MYVISSQLRLQRVKKCCEGFLGADVSDGA